MNAHLKTLLNVSGIAKRNGSLPLARAGKVCVNTLMSRQVYPLNRVLRPFYIQTLCQKLVCRLGRYTFSLCQQPASMMVP
jgi:hypothetical protein